MWRVFRQVDTGAKDGAAVRIPPPIVYILAIVAGTGLQELIWPLPLALARGPRVALALLVTLLGVALVAGALKLFRATDQDPKPWLATPEIVRAGVYRFTRNPMYVGFALLQSAIGIGLGNVWILLLVPLSCVVVQITAIRHEEEYLERKFGDTYLAYKRSVRQWF
jgi:protein-S-isoprenylcysteine O-methyltransferase Ste14